MQPGDTILTQSYTVGRVLRIEDPRVYYIPLATPDAKPEMAWLARVAVIPADVVNTLWGAGETPVVDDAPAVVARYQPVPDLPVQPAPTTWWQALAAWWDRVTA